jgi:GST-like protein
MTSPPPTDRPTLCGAKGWGSTLAEAMLAVAGIPYEFVDVDGFDKPGPERDLLLRFNPLAQVPTLVLADGQVMTESAAIALYLAEAAPDSGLAPAPGSSDRPRFLRYLVWLAANVYPTFTYGDYPERWATTGSKELRVTTDAYRGKLWLWFDDEAGAPHVLGDRFSALDIYVAVMTRWRPGRPWFEAHTPRLTAIADAAAAHPAVGPVLKRNF